MLTTLLLIYSFLAFEFLVVNGICQSIIFCQGDLLHTVQTSGIFQDCKTFVDMNLISSVDVTIQNFDEMMAKTNNNPSKKDIINFVTNNFQSEDSELEIWKPKDYNPNPPFLDRISNPEIKSFAKHLVSVWLTLGRRIKLHVYKNLDKYSIIPLPNGFIIPGGRFREIYYWDSLWIVRGLLLCDMDESVRGILENFFYIISSYGFVPNGGRIYYLDRSHPPLLTKMVLDYLVYTENWPWLRQNIKYLDIELTYWVDNHMVDIMKDQRIYNLFIYRSFADDPRPESYSEDVYTASYYMTPKERRICYRAIRSGAESGWDFSSRWFFEFEENIAANLTGINTPRILPVDLNSFLAEAFKILGNFYTKLNYPMKAAYWLELASQLEEAIANVLYDPEDGIWYDYDKKMAKHRKNFFPSNLTPLWTKPFNTSMHMKYGTNAVQYLKRNNIPDYVGGIPSSLEDTGEQWDFPNAWAPLQSIVIGGLHTMDHDECKKMAKEFANNWLQSNLKTYDLTKEMFEKYNSVHPGIQGGGGEYEVQTGFGWSNGVVLELIDIFYVKNKILN